MEFYEVLDDALALLRSRGRVTYRALKIQFQLDEEQLEALKEEIQYAHEASVQADDRGLIWTGDTDSVIKPPPSPVTLEPTSVPADEPQRALSSYTPAYLAEKILTSKSGLEGERKVVTVLFADIKDSTELIRDLDPEDAQKLLDPAIHMMMEAVHRFEGTVNQVLGDGVMSLFGAPIAHEDHAARACYAALAMQAAMRDYSDDVRSAHGIEMQIRVGLHSGEVVVRTIGNDLHMDYSAVGPTTHLAARMEQLAQPGSIRLSAATFQLVEGLVQVNDLGPIPVKEIDEPVEVFELTGDLRYESFGQLVYPAVAARTGLVQCHAELGEFTAGHTARGEAVQIAEALNHPVSLTFAYGPASDLYLIQGDIAKAIPWLERALILCQTRHMAFHYSTIAANLGWAYALSQRDHEAWPLLQESEKQDNVMRRPGQRPERLLEAYLVLGRVAEVYARATQALARVRLEQRQGPQAHLLRLLGDLYSHHYSSEVDQAEAYYQQALTLAIEINMRPLQAHCHRGLGTLYNRTGRSAQARVELATAIEMYRDMEMAFWLPETEAALVTVEGR